MTKSPGLEDRKAHGEQPRTIAAVRALATSGVL